MDDYQNPQSLRPPRLRPGDRVRIVSPACPPSREEVARGVELLTSWGLQAELGQHVFDQWGYKLLHESAARADEMLRLNVEDLYPQDKRGRTTAKAGATSAFPAVRHHPTPPRLTPRRTHGPLIHTGRKAPAGTPTPDIRRQTAPARLSCRRTEDIFEENTRLPANPLASPEDTEAPDGWTLHPLRHSTLTHDAEDSNLHPDAAGPLPPHLRPLPKTSSHLVSLR